MDESQLSIVDILERDGKLTPQQVSAIKLENINTGVASEKIIVDRNLATEKDIASVTVER